MSQIVYTELEGYPLRWEYKGAVPRESKTEADRTSKSWSVATTPATQVSNTNTGTANNVYAANMVGQSFKSPANATKVTAVQLYGNKAGAPPNPLFVELRKTSKKWKTTNNTERGEISPISFVQVSDPFTVTVDFSTAGDKTLATVTDSLPAGNKIIIFSVIPSNTSIGVVMGYLKLVYGTTTIQHGLTYHIAFPETPPLMIFGYYENAPANAQYSLFMTVTGTTTSGSKAFHVQAMVIYLGSNSAVFASNTNTSIAAGATVTLTSINTAFPTGSKVVVLAALIKMTSSGNAVAINAGNIRIKSGATTVSQNEYAAYSINNYVAGVHLSYLDTTASASQSYSIEIYNNTSYSASAWGEIIAFKVDDGAFLDTASVALSNTQTTIGSLATTLSGNIAVIGLTSIQNTSGSSQSISVDAIVLQANNDATYQTSNKVSPFISNGWAIIPTFFLTTASLTSPSFQSKATAPVASGMNGEAKMIALKLPNHTSAVLKISFDYEVRQVGLRIVKIGNPSDITVKVYRDGVLINSSTLSNIATTYSNYTITIPEVGDFEDTAYMVELSYTTDGVGDYVFRTGSGQPTPVTVSSNKWVIPYFPILEYAFISISDTVLASGSIAASSVGTSAAWINISLSAPIVLRPSTYYTIVVYTIGGDASNRYVIHNGGTGGTPGGRFEVFFNSTDSGSTWTENSATDLSFKVDGVQYTQIYSGTIQNNVKHPLGSVILQLSLKAQTSSSMEFAGFDDHTLTSPVTTSTSTSQTEIIAIRPTDARLRNTINLPQVSWSIWAAGSGLSTRAYTQRYVYMTKNPVYPSDFGYSELYLVMAELPPKALVALNDNIVGGLYNSSETETRIDAFELFRIPVRKAEVIAEPTSGKIVLYFVGLE
ncbi:MAG: hypothetical protein QXN77_08150 [Candidatus Caldarchaeum sp.]